MRVIFAAPCAVAVAVTLTIGTVAFADQSLDDSFSGDGVVKAGSGDLGSGGFDAYIDVEPVVDGYVATGGWGEGRIVVAKYLEDGSPDTTFGNDGRRVIKIGAYAEGLDVMSRPSSGFIILATTIAGFALVSIDDNGAINRDFGRRGIAKQRTRTSLQQQAALDSEERIVVAVGEKTSKQFQTTRLRVWRFKKGGGVDRSFSGGAVTASPQRVNDPTGVVTDDQDHIWIVTSQFTRGRPKAGASMLRISQAGTRVQTVRRFSAWSADGTYPVGIDRRSDGSFLIGITGNTTGRVGAIALKPSGRKVRNYGENGLVTASCQFVCYVSEQDLDASEGLVLAGGADTKTRNRFGPDDTWVARFTADGRRDRQFVNGWEGVFKQSREFDMAFGVTVDDQDRVLLPGMAKDDAFLLRLAEVV